MIRLIRDEGTARNEWGWVQIQTPCMRRSIGVKQLLGAVRIAGSLTVIEYNGATANKIRSVQSQEIPTGDGSVRDAAIREGRHTS